MIPTGLTEDAPWRMRTPPPIPAIDQSACIDLDRGQDSVPQALSDDLSEMQLGKKSANGDYKRTSVLEENLEGLQNYSSAESNHDHNDNEVCEDDRVVLRYTETQEEDSVFTHNLSRENLGSNIETVKSETKISYAAIRFNTSGENSSDNNYDAGEGDEAPSRYTPVMVPLNESSSSSTIENESDNGEERVREHSLDHSETVSLVSDDYSFDGTPVSRYSDRGFESGTGNETSLFDELNAGRLRDISSTSLDSGEGIDKNSDNDVDNTISKDMPGATNLDPEDITLTLAKTPERAAPNKLNLIVSPLQPIKSFKNGVAIFVCEVISKRVGVAWQKDGQEIEASSKYVLTRAGKMHSLTIHNVQAGDEGQYSVVCDDDQASSAELEVRGVSTS